jgi:hypothetical protein
MNPQPQPTSSGLQSVQDLYDLINGKTTTQSGGTTTKTESGSFSQDSMNQMLKSALEGTNGLAAVAGGQRTAGGYGSSTNQLLINDLLTRSAGQIAQLNTSKTTQTTTPQSTSTVGGATLTGGAKTAGFLGALQALDKSGALAWTKKNLNLGKEATPIEQATGVAGVNAGNESYYNPANQTVGAVGTDNNPSLYSVDMSNAVVTPDVSTPTSADQTSQVSGDVFAMPDIGIDMTTVPDAPAMTEDPLAFLNTDDMANAAMTDQNAGGKSTKKALGSMLGTQSNVVIDPRTGLVGGALSYNPDAVAAAVNLNSQGTSVGSNLPGSSYSFGPDTSGPSGVNSGGSLSRGDVAALSGITSAVGSLTGIGELGQLGKLGAFASSPALSDLGGIGSRALSGDTTKADVSNVSSSLGALANVLGDKNLGNVATIGKIASAPSLGSAAMGVANIATEGLAGKVKSLAENIASPSLTGTIDAVAAFNPLSATYNAVANFADVATLGQIAANANASINPNQMMNPNLQAIANESPIGQAVDRMNQNSAFGDSEAASMASGGSTGDPDANAAGDSAAGRYGGGGSFGSSSRGGNDAHSGDSSHGDAGASNSGGSGGSGSGEADGGPISGQGSSVSDSIPTHLSDGEFVLSADVVRAVGIDKLQKLQDKYHVPVAVQKLQKFARG